MTLYLNGTTGISGVDGSAGTPAVQGTDTNTGISFPAADTIAFNEGGAEVGRFDSSGRLLIGTSTAVGGIGAGSKLQIRGNTAAAGAKLSFQRDQAAASIGTGEEVGQLVFASNDGGDYALITARSDGASSSTSDCPGRLEFSTCSDGSASPTERMRITSKGHVGIGVTPTLPLQVFQATDDAAGAPLAALNKGYAGDVGHAVIHLGKQDNNSTTSQIFQRFYINAAATGSGMITANGASQATFSSFSDIRLKENIQDLPSQLQAICSLRPVEFDYKDGSGHQIGFIAQEVEEVYPDLIGKADNEMLTLSGMGKHEARLIKAIQELKDELDAAKQRIAALESA